MKKIWCDRVTTVFPRQGRFALDPEAIATYPAPEITVEHISDLLTYDLSDLTPGRPLAAKQQVFN